MDLVLAHLLFDFTAVGERRDPIAILLQDPFNQLTGILIVVHHQNADIQANAPFVRDRGANCTSTGMGTHHTGVVGEYPTAFLVLFRPGCPSNARRFKGVAAVFVSHAGAVSEPVALSDSVRARERRPATQTNYSTPYRRMSVSTCSRVAGSSTYGRYRLSQPAAPFASPRYTEAVPSPR